MIHGFFTLDVSPPVSLEDYGCDEPEIDVVAATHDSSGYHDGELNDFGIVGGDANSHDIEFSQVRFTGNAGGPGSGNGYGSRTTTGMKITTSGQGNIYNILYDRCIFATDTTGGSQANAFHAICSYGRIYNIFFDHCWFDPYSRIGIELNGRGGWMHDWTLDRCTVKAGLGEIFSCDMSPVNGDAVSPWGANISGIVRGWEGLHVTNNLFEGNGRPSVAGYTMAATGYPTRWRMGHELSCIYPYCPSHTPSNPNTYTPDAGQLAATRSEFRHNKTGRCYSAFYQTNRNGVYYLDFEENLFDDSYNPHLCTVRADTAISGVQSSHCDFIDNVYKLGNHSTVFVSGYDGDHNVYRREGWTKSGTINADFDATDSSYEDCHFVAGNLATIDPSSTRDSDCTGYTGGELVP